MIMDKRRAKAEEQSRKLMEAANGKPMTRKQFARAIDQQESSVAHTIAKLKRYGLPVPEIQRIYTSRFRTEVELPETEYRREHIADELWPSSLQVADVYYNQQGQWVARLK